MRSSVEREVAMNLPLSSIPTPCYICDELQLIENLKILQNVQEGSQCKIILALKGFAMFSTFPLLKQYLQGTTASSVHEARLGFEEFGKEVHIYSPAYKEKEMTEIIDYADHIIFNSFAQWRRFRPLIAQKAKRPISCGLRVNPEHSEVEQTLYNPCSPCSRLGIVESEFQFDQLEGIEGIHFHTLCESNANSLVETWKVVEQKFGSIFPSLKWINLGGGHHITKEDYDLAQLIQLIDKIRKKYDVDVILEPGEAVALNAGYLVSTVVDIVKNQMNVAILDASATTHMPDVLEMPYRPQILGASEPDDFPYTYRLTGTTCLAGDIIGDYSFPQPLQIGDPLVFTDMLHYTMVKNHTFNGINLPSIAIWTGDQQLKVIRSFGYTDYKTRLS